MPDEVVACPFCELNATTTSHQDYLMKRGDIHVLKGPWFEKWPGHVMMVYAPEHIEEQSEIPSEGRAVVLEDIIQIESAIRKVCQPKRINFAKFGNVVSHLHWHLVPRFHEERFLQKCPWEILTEVDLYTRLVPRNVDSFYVKILAEISR